MKKEFGYVTDREGNAVAGAEVYIRLQADNTLATLYSDDGVTTTANPLTTDNDGEWSAYWANGVYKVQIYVDGVQQQEVNNFQHFDIDGLTAFGSSLIDDASASAARDTLEVYSEDEINALLSTVGGPPIPNGLVSGGQVAWESGLTFRMSAAVYYIDGVQYSAAEQTVTLDAADATNDRIDVIAVNTSGTLVKVTGTAAAAPSEPDIDPSTQLKLTFVLVDSTATAPTGVTVENIYLENTEWTSSTSGSGFNANSTNNPYAGTKTIEGTTVASGAYVQLQHGSSITPASYDMLRLFIRSKAAWSTGRVLRLQFYSAGVAKGTAVTLASGYWGFDSSNTSAYQFVAIPMSQFVIPSGTTVNQLRITDAGGSIGFYIDNITLQSTSSTIGGSGSGFLTQANNLSDLTSVSSARGNLGLGTIATFNEATTAQVRSNTADLALSTDQTWAAADYVALTDAATVAVDLSAGINFSLTIGGNRTLGAPSNTKNGQSGEIIITQDGTGSRTLAYHANWKFAGGTDPVLSTAAGAIDVLSYKVVNSTFIIASLTKAFA